MKNSRRSRRMQRHHRRGQNASLNRVSLMDIFTILVFFLLVNSSDTEVLPNSKLIQLPASVAEQKPRETLVVMLTNSDVLLQGKPILSIDKVRKSSAASFPALINALSAQGQKIWGDKKAIREVTVLGGKTLPYHMLKKIIYSCSLAGFSKVSLAVVQKSYQGED